MRDIISNIDKVAYEYYRYRHSCKFNSRMAFYTDHQQELYSTDSNNVKEETNKQFLKLKEHLNKYVNYLLIQDK